MKRHSKSSSTSVVLVCAIVLTTACITNDSADSSESSQPEPGTTLSVATTTSLAVATTTSPADPTTTTIDDDSLTVVESEPYRKPEDGDPSTVDIFMADGSGESTTVVLLHGWGLSSPGRPAVDLARFAEEVARLGATVFYFRWHTNNGFSAGSAADLSCMGGFVAARAAEFGASTDNVVVVGHSMGGETGSKLALSSFGLAPGDDCLETGEPPTPYAFLGIGGTYGLIAQPLDGDLNMFAVRATPESTAREIASDEFVTPGLTALQAYALDGASALPSTNPLRMVLLVGTEDQYSATNPTITAEFAGVLKVNGTEAEQVLVEGANHEDVMDPDASAGRSTLEVVADLLDDAP